MVFEGAQGLKLDEFAPDYPHVTRSRTGSPNIITLCRESGISDIDLHYVSRSYLTRHGNGPLRNEVAQHPYGWTGLETNQDHEFQGRFRYAKLDPAILTRDISLDAVQWMGTGITVRPTLALTCFDQLPISDAAMLITGIRLTSGIKIGHTAFGPTRETVIENESYAQSSRAS